MNAAKGNKSKKTPGKDGPKRAELGSATPALEWIFAISGLVLVTLMLTFIGMNAAKNDRSPPNVSIKTLSVVPNGSGFLVLFQADNKGGSTAAALTIEGVLMDGEKEVASSNVTFDYLPAQSFRNGGLFFEKDPSRYKMELRPLGFQEP